MKKTASFLMCLLIGHAFFTGVNSVKARAGLGRGHGNHGYQDFAGLQGNYAYPFLTNLALPVSPGRVAMRIAAVRNTEDTDYENDIFINLEAGLIRNIGIQLRSDGILNDEYVMTALQYAVYKFKRYNPGGISLTVQVELPVEEKDNIDANYLGGFSFKYRLNSLMDWNTNVLFDFMGDTLKYETAFVFPAGHNFYPVIEFNGYANGINESYMVGGVKLRLNEVSSVGVGVKMNLRSEGQHHVDAENFHRQHGQKTFFMFETIF